MIDLQPFYAPRSIAVVGAGERATSSGGAVMQMLLRAGFKGRLEPINPKGGTVFGLAAHTSLRALAAPVDLVVISIRPDAILEAVNEAAATGHRHLLILPGGFAEAGAEGLARHHALMEVIRQRDIVVAGPNCAGLIHLTPEGGIAPSFLRDLPAGRAAGQQGVALISQSGAIAEEVIAASHRLALPVTTVISIGNAVQIGVEDHLAHLGRDDSIAAVILYLESLDDPAAFRRIARQVAAVKPVVALVGGRTAAGAAAATAHTGAVANDASTIQAFLTDCGLVGVDSLADLLLAAKAFARYPSGAGQRVVIISNSGGPGVLAADAAVRAGLSLPPLPSSMVARLRAALPAEAAIANPVDLLADAREDRFGAALAAALEEADAFDQILLFHTAPFMVEAGPVVDCLAERAATATRPVFHAMAGTLTDGPAWFQQLEAAGIAMSRDPEAMARMAGLLAAYPPLQAHAARNPDTAIHLKGRR